MQKENCVEIVEFGKADMVLSSQVEGTKTSSTQLEAKKRRNFDDDAD